MILNVAVLLRSSCTHEHEHVLKRGFVTWKWRISKFHSHLFDEDEHWAICSISSDRHDEVYKLLFQRYCNLIEWTSHEMMWICMFLIGVKHALTGRCESLEQQSAASTQNGSMINCSLLSSDSQGFTGPA